MKVSSLKDFSPLQSIEKDGLVIEGKKRKGFLLKVEGLDGRFLSEDERARLHESWRSFLRLSSDEEIQIVFRQGVRFEDLLVQRMHEAEGMSAASLRYFFEQKFSEVLKELQAEEKSLFRPECLLYWSHLEKNTSEESTYSKRDILIQQLEQMGLFVESLSGEKTLQHISEWAGGIEERGLGRGVEELPEVSLDPQKLLIEKKRIRTLTLKKLPEAFSEFGMMEAFSRLPFPVELCVRFRGKDTRKVKKKFERKKQVVFGLLSNKVSGDPGLEAQFRENDDLLRRLEEQSEGLCEMTLTIGLRGSEKKIKWLTRAIESVFQLESSLHSLEFEETTLNAFDCYLELIPCFRGKVFHQKSILSSNAIHFLPFFRADEGHQNAIISFRRQDGGLFHINPISEELANYNWLISGTSGAGKSFLVNKVLLDSQVLKPQVFIVDLGGSYTKITKFLGGRNLGLDVSEGFQLSPFFIEKSKDEKEELQRMKHIELILSEMCRDEGKLPSLEERAILSECLEVLCKSKLPEFPLTALRELLVEKGEKRLSLLLKRWCKGSFYGQFLDNKSELRVDRDVINFDLRGLKEFEDLRRVVELIICSSLWSAIKKRDRFTWIVLDEVAFSLLQTQPQFVDELISTVRKHFAGVIVVVQDLAKITQNSAGASILQNTQIKVILQQRGDEKLFSEPLGLSLEERAAIRSLQRKKGSFSDAFLMVNDRRSVIRYTPNFIEYVLNTSDPQENKHISEELQKFEGSFPERIIQWAEASA